MKKLYRILALALLAMLCVGCDYCDGEIELWPDGIIYYKMDNSFSKQEMKVVLECIKELEDKTVLKFVEAEKNTLKWYCLMKRVKGNKSQASYGYRKNSYVKLSDSALEYTDTLIHEILHVVGLIHEHQREDRNRYVKINFDIIKNSEWDQYEIKSPKYYKKVIDQVPYDYLSIMHYGIYMDKKTDAPQGSESITILDENFLKYKLFSSRILTDNDIKKINLIYSK